jgi:predicted dehydrogenase
LTELIGQPQAVFGIYGNGLLNNGTHMVDFIRMLFGEIEVVQAVSGILPYADGPIPDDVNVPFSLRLSNGLAVTLQPVSFKHYRENSLDIWGEEARLALMQEGLGIFLYPQCKNRAVQGQREVASDKFQVLESTVGHAFYHMYSNLADALHQQVSLWSSGESALHTAKVVEAVMASVEHGRSIKLTGT